jgi:site-specific DNA-methyltransferase (adenine-specific)
MGLATHLGLPRPYYEDDSVALFHGDMRELVPLFPRVAAVIADPPYEETELKWDHWPKGWPAMMLGKSPQLWVFGSLRMFLEQRDEFSGWKLAQDIVWEKHNSASMQNDRFRRVHEQAVHFYQGEWSLLGLKSLKVEVEEETRHKSARRRVKPEHMGQINAAPVYEYRGVRNMRSVISHPSCHGYAVHPTQKPEAIICPLIEYSVPPGGLVLDPFAGSCTTLRVAKDMGRRALGIEADAQYLEAAADRLREGALFAHRPARVESARERQDSLALA